MGNAGDLLTQITVFWTGLVITGSALSVAGLGGVWTLCAALAGLISGPVVDRFNRRNLLLVLHTVLALLCFVVFSFALSGTLRLWHLLLFLAGEAILGTPVSAAFAALLPDIVAKDQLVRVNGLLSSWGMADNLIEAAVSGVLLALWGPAPLFLFNGVMYLVGAGAALLLPASVGKPSLAKEFARWQPIRDLRISIRYIRQERLLRRLVPLDVTSAFIYAPVFFLPSIVADAVGMGSEGFGFIQSLTLGGILVGSLVASAWGTKWPKVPMWIGGRILMALALLILGLELSPFVALAVFFLVGIGATGGRVYGETLVQQVIPSGIRGRINGIQSFLGGVLQPVSIALIMALIEATSLPPVTIGLGVAMGIITVGYIALLPIREGDWSLSHTDDTQPG